MQNCPSCGGVIRGDATRCEDCGATVAQRQGPATEKATDASSRESDTKACPYCAEPIRAAAVVCRFCGRTLESRPPSNLSGGVLIAVALFGLLWFGAFSLRGVPKASQSSLTPRAAPGVAAPVATPEPEPAPVLQLLASRGYEGDGSFHYVEGQVRNASAKPLEHVAAVATWYTKSGEFVSSDSALIDYTPLLPGQTSAFKTMTRSNPEMSRYTVEFKALSGGQIPTEDMRKQR